MLELQNIRKQFNGKTVADGINLQVARGSLLAILGRSGCGKSTLLNIAAGLTAPDGGRVLLDGTDITALPPEKRRISLMFQDYALLPHLTVLQNTAFGLKMRGTAKRQAEEVAEAMLEQVGLSGEGHRRPDTLSGGEQQRVALARALAAEPKLLLLDEPFGALDAKVRKELRAWLRDIHHQLGITSILVTHDQEEALEVSDQIVVMNHGRIEQTGSADDIYLRPKNAFVTEFLGHTEAFEGRVAQGAWHYGGYARALDGQWQEQTATAYIRPHEWQIESEKPMLRGTIRALHHAGALARLTIETADGRRIRADLPAAEATRLNLQTGQTLPIAPRQIYVFGQSELIDFAI